MENLSDFLTATLGADFKSIAATSEEAIKANASKLLTDTPSSLNEGDVIIKMSEPVYGYLTINGEQQSRVSVIYECEVSNPKWDSTRQRAIHLSTLVRKIDNAKVYEGMIGQHEAFKNSHNFTVKDWDTAFKAAVPFRVKKKNVSEPREFTRTDGTVVTNTIKELVFEKVN